MAFNSYYPATYQQMAHPVQQQMPQMQMPQAQQGGSIVWTQGIEGAKSYLVAPGQSVMLMDSESNVFYIKSADQSGMPLPLRIFDYTERTTEHTIPEVKNQPSTSEFVTREEFERRLEELLDEKTKPTPRKEKTA